jgi:hypothetical protein
VRFVFGSIVRVFAGLIAGRYGPGVAGLFLAFSAIFPAGATLIEKQEREKKRRAGLDGTSRGRAAVGIDAIGAAMGDSGPNCIRNTDLAPLPSHSSPAILIIAGLAWLAIWVMA